MINWIEEIIEATKNPPPPPAPEPEPDNIIKVDFKARKRVVE